MSWQWRDEITDKGYAMSILRDMNTSPYVTSRNDLRLLLEKLSSTLCADPDVVVEFIQAHIRVLSYAYTNARVHTEVLQIIPPGLRNDRAFFEKLAEVCPRVVSGLEDQIEKDCNAEDWEGDYTFCGPALLSDLKHLATSQVLRQIRHIASTAGQAGVPRIHNQRIQRTLVVMKTAPDCARHNDAVAHSALQITGLALQYLSSRFRNDPAIVLPVLVTTPEAVRFISTRLKNDPAFMLPVLAASPEAIRFVGKKFYSNQGMMRRFWAVAGTASTRMLAVCVMMACARAIASSGLEKAGAAHDVCGRGSRAGNTLSLVWLLPRLTTARVMQRILVGMLPFRNALRRLAIQAGTVRHGDVVVLKSRVCRVLQAYRPRAGKHGHVKISICGLSMLTGSRVMVVKRQFEMMELARPDEAQCDRCQGRLRRNALQRLGIGELREVAESLRELLPKPCADPASAPPACLVDMVVAAAKLIPAQSAASTCFKGVHEPPVVPSLADRINLSRVNSP